MWFSLMFAMVSCVLAGTIYWITFIPLGAEPAHFVLGVLTLVAVGDVAWDIAVQLCRGFMTNQTIPRLTFVSEVPDDCRTLIVVPALVTSTGHIDQLVANLASRMSGNRESNVVACLVTDFVDSPLQISVDDDELLTRLCSSMTTLNNKYDGGFFLFHRARTWNPQDGKWMGRERKRGKLEDLNHWLTGHSVAGFELLVGKRSDLGDIKYVLTLDEDSVLASGAARKLIQAIAHPANRPVVDASTNSVKLGRGIIQPVPWVTVGRGKVTPYQALSSSRTPPGGDFYQELCGEGSFYGKGIYDLQVFHQVLHGRFPDNTVLSHDLIEGAYLRSGIVYDPVLEEIAPSTLMADLARRHRWTRGDWQNLRWVLPYIRVETGAWQRNPLSALSRMKIIDNVRRTILPICFLATLIAGASKARCLLLLMPFLGAIVQGALMHVQGDFKSMGSARGFLLRTVAIRALWIAYLPVTVATQMDAIVRSLYRQIWSRRGLLEWRTSVQTETASAPSFGRYIRLFATPSLIASALLVLFESHAGYRGGGAGLVAAWILSPLLAWSLDRPKWVAEGVPEWI
ncbi:hypothetical protein P3W33_17510 [Luteibacter sp. PPL552]